MRVRVRLRLSLAGGRLLCGRRPAGLRLRGLLAPAGAAAVPVLPAGVVPVATQVRRLGRNHHDVADPWADVLLATGADVGLQGLERLNPADLDRSAQRGINAHSNSPATTATAAATMT